MSMHLTVCLDCFCNPCQDPKRALDDCCACSGEVCGDATCPAIELVSCEVCERGDREEELLLCDGCDHACHLSCMRPPLRSVPALWFCSRCKMAAMQKRRRVGGTSDAATSSSSSSSTLIVPDSNSIARHGLATAHSAASSFQGKFGGKATRGGRSGKEFFATAQHSVPWCGSEEKESGEVQEYSDAELGTHKLFLVDEEFMQRLKKDKLKACSCKKSRCLKQYCECFREKEFCSSSRCNCSGCLNLPGKPLHIANASGQRNCLCTLPACLAFFSIGAFLARCSFALYFTTQATANQAIPHRCLTKAFPPRSLLLSLQSLVLFFPPLGAPPPDQAGPNPIRIEDSEEGARQAEGR